VNGEAVTGSIQTDTGLFRIRPLGGGAHALIRVGKFPQEHPPSFNEKLREQRDLPPFERKSQLDTSTTELRILVVYTPRVESRVTDVKGLVDLAFLETNQSYRDSGVQIVATSATPAPLKVNYTEGGSHDADLAALQNKTDGKMDEIHQARDDSRADVVVLLIDDGSYCGLASQILATKDTAFAVVYHDCATGYYSFAHEIGHLQGARHNPEADPTNAPFPYGHGYMDTARNRRTIMSYDCPSGCPRMPQWARPVDWGTVDLSHDARVLNETSKYIGGFR
jgi:peptidyl-Asp metalloendopeptidase